MIISNITHIHPTHNLSRGKQIVRREQLNFSQEYSMPVAWINRLIMEELPNFFRYYLYISGNTFSVVVRLYYSAKPLMYFHLSPDGRNITFIVLVGVIPEALWINTSSLNKKKVAVGCFSFNYAPSLLIRRLFRRKFKSMLLSFHCWAYYQRCLIFCSRDYNVQGQLTN